MVQGQKYHFIYRTTCKITGRYYVGVHSTKNLEDGYLGSGKFLGNSIAKHGRENHEREILEFFDTREDLMKREREFVNEEMLKDSQCMNLCKGGDGGNILLPEDKSKQASKSMMTRWKKDREKMSILAQKNRNKSRWKGGIANIGTFTGKILSESHRKKIGVKTSISQKGENNSQANKFWITDGNCNARLSVGEIIPDGWKKGRFCQKIGKRKVKKRWISNDFENRMIPTIDPFLS